MDRIKPLFTATATASGGRNGHTESSDGVVAADLSLPREMGGAGKPRTATPEHLFAAGYAGCFGGALGVVGKQRKQDASKAEIVRLEETLDAIADKVREYAPSGSPHAKL